MGDLSGNYEIRRFPAVSKGNEGYAEAETWAKAVGFGFHDSTRTPGAVPCHLRGRWPDLHRGLPDRSRGPVLAACRGARCHVRDIPQDPEHWFRPHDGDADGHGRDRPHFAPPARPP